MSFAKYMGKNLHKRMSKNLSSKYRQKVLDYAKQSATYALKSASTKAIQKTAEPNRDFSGSKIANKVAQASKNHPKIFQRQLKVKRNS